MKLAVVGTSHINSIKFAFDSEQSRLPSCDSVFYFGMKAPILSKQNQNGWPGDPGTMSFDLPEGRAFINRIFKDPNRIFIPESFDVILFVDMFFCYDFSHICRDADESALRVDNILVSDIAYREILEARLGKSKYSMNCSVGQVPENSLMPLLETIRQRAPEASIYLTPRPMIPNDEHGRNTVRMNCSGVAQGARLFDDAANSKLSSIGITYLPRDKTQICEKSALTPKCFSVGRLATDSSRLDEHMNGEYGEIVLQSLSKNLHSKSAMRRSL